MDTRVSWLKSKVESGLFVELEAAKQVPTITQGPADLLLNPLKSSVDPFNDCLERDGGKHYAELLDFLNGSSASSSVGRATSSSSSALVFWAETVTLKTLVQPPEEVITETTASSSTSALTAAAVVVDATETVTNPVDASLQGANHATTDEIHTVDAESTPSDTVLVKVPDTFYVKNIFY